jgi:hypothetical protein
VWITLLIDAFAGPPQPEKSRAWLDCTEKEHQKKTFKINDLAPLWVL